MSLPDRTTLGLPLTGAATTAVPAAAAAARTSSPAAEETVEDADYEVIDEDEPAAKA